MAAEPRPTIRTARSSEAWCSGLVNTRIAGAPARPSRSTSQPRAASRLCRAASRQVTCAIWQPVTKAKLAPEGRPSTSFSQTPAASSTMAAAGLTAKAPAFWSQTLVSQSAARADGTAPPTTQAWNRPPAFACRPGSTAATSSSITRAASQP